MIRHGGMAVAVSGVEEEITVDMRLFEFDKTYINPLYGQCKPERDFDRVFALHASGQMKLDELVTRTYPIDDVGAGVRRSVGWPQRQGRARLLMTVRHDGAVRSALRGRRPAPCDGDVGRARPARRLHVLGAAGGDRHRCRW